MQNHQEHSSTENLIERGIQGIKTGLYTSIRNAAKSLEIDRSTLTYRYEGRQSRVVAHQNQQNLSESEELALTKWISTSTVIGTPPSYKTIREMADQIRQNRVHSINERIFYPPLGKNWVGNFMKRHPQFKATYTRRIEASRIEQSTEERCKNWLDAVSEVLREHNIPASNVYNMDETGFNVGVAKTGRIVIDLRQNVNYKKQPGRQEWLTLIECICADGSTIPPLVIFKGKTFPVDQVLQCTEDSWRFSCSNKGWTSNELGADWLRRCFEPATREKANMKPRILILDGHESHITSQFLFHCFHNNIIVLRLPPHTSHILQPLDVGIFGPLKTYLGQELEKFMRAEVTRIKKGEWLDAYSRARPKAFSKENIHGAWRGAGLFPVNHQKVLRNIPSCQHQETGITETSITPASNILNTSLISSSPLDSEALHAANNVLKQALQSGNPLKTPERSYVVRLTKAAERLRAQVSILETENKELKGVVKVRREATRGRQLVLKDQLVLTRPELLEKLAALENEDKKGRGKRKHNKDETTDKCEDIEGNIDNVVETPVLKRKRMVLHAVVV